jgi:hypothetical protein
LNGPPRGDAIFGLWPGSVKSKALRRQASGQTQKRKIPER